MKFDKIVGSVGIHFDSARIDRNLENAQKTLNESIVADSEKYIPFQQGALRGSVRFPQGIYGGQIEYDTPYAHYMYAGQVYGPNIPIKDAAGNITGWWSPPEKYPTGRQLQYHTPGTGAQWFEVAKEKHLKDWEKAVEEELKKE